MQMRAHGLDWAQMLFSCVYGSCRCYSLAGINLAIPNKLPELPSDVSNTATLTERNSLAHIVMH